MVVTMNNVVYLDMTTQFRTSQKAHYISATEPTRLMLCKI
jgi:hypothetical protein